MLGGGSIFDQIGRGIESIWKTIVGFFTSILDVLNPFSDNFFLKKLGEAIASGFQAVCDAIGGIAKAIGDVITEIFKFLFIPSEERLTAISNTIKEKFTFIDSISLAVDSIKNVLNNIGNVPKINLQISATKYTDSMNLDVIDMTWYTPFKAYGDLILTGFIYFAFVWRIFIRLSAIITGQAGVVVNDFDKISSIEKELKD